VPQQNRILLARGAALLSGTFAFVLNDLDVHAIASSRILRLRVILRNVPGL
jgi:hypothetical protein